MTDNRTVEMKLIDEKNEVTARVTRLNFFIGHSPKFEKLSSEMQELLKEQNEIMFQYCEVLEKRINLLRFEGIIDG